MEFSPLLRHFCLCFASLLAINFVTIAAHAQRPRTRDGDTTLLRADRYFSASSGSTPRSPVLKRLSPTATPASSATFSLQVAGASFSSGSVVLWNGTRQPTKRANNNLLYATISSTLVAAAGTAQISVLTPMGTQSNALTFLITAPTSPPLAITTSSLPQGSNGLSYGASLAATGGNSPYGWRLASGSLPPGLALSTAGQISGTPSIEGSYSFSVRVSDSTVPMQSTTRGYTISVSSPPTPSPSASPLVIAASDPTWIVGQAIDRYIFPISGGVKPYDCWMTGGATIPGVSLFQHPWDDDGCMISGYPSSAGTYTLNLLYKDQSGQSLTTSRTVIVCPVGGCDVQPSPAAALAITTTSLPAGSVDSPYAATVSASGGLPGYTWSVASGSLPPGLILGAVTGQISGTPSSSGNYGFTLRVTDSASPSQSATQSFSINVSAPSLPTITTTSLPGATQDQFYSATLSASGGTPPYSWSLTSGSLPSGLTLSGSTGTIAGNPTATGTFNFSVQVRDAASQVASRALSITVNQTVSSSPPSGLLFAHDFETCSLRYRGDGGVWSEIGSGCYGTACVSQLYHHSGNCSAQGWLLGKYLDVGGLAGPKPNGGWDELWARVWVAFDNNWIASGGSAAGVHFFDLMTTTPTGGSSDPFWSASTDLDEVGTSNDWRLSVRSNGTVLAGCNSTNPPFNCGIYPDRNFVSDNLVADKSAAPGTWRCFEMHAKLNDPGCTGPGGTCNGFIEIYRDGNSLYRMDSNDTVAIGSRGTGRCFEDDGKCGNFRGEQSNWGMKYFNAHGNGVNTPGQNVWWVDDVAVGTSRLGCGPIANFAP